MDDNMQMQLQGLKAKVFSCPSAPLVPPFCQHLFYLYIYPCTVIIPVLLQPLLPHAYSFLSAYLSQIDMQVFRPSAYRSSHEKDPDFLFYFLIMKLIFDDESGW